jgi:imidazole glycerol-phosphate synthase subunit HisF
MLKIRVMPTLLFKDIGLVKDRNFTSQRRIGAPLQAIKVYNMRDVDELVFLDVGATPGGRPPDFAMIDDLADECFMPLTVGGGVRHVEDIRALLRVGADKVAINSAAVDDPALIRRGADAFGSQCIVVSIDVRRRPDGSPEVVTRCGTHPTGLDPVAWAIEAERLGAGEILLTSIDRDGTMEGYDMEVTRAVSGAVSIPLIASGGAGRYADMAAVLRVGGVAAVAAASMFHFTEQTPREARNFLKNEGFSVRI